MRFWSKEDINMIHTSMPHLTRLTLEYTRNYVALVLTRLTQLRLLQVATVEGVPKPKVVKDLQRIPNVQIVARYDYNFQYLENYDTKFLV